MKTAHTGMNCSETEFVAVLDDLPAAMAKHGVGDVGKAEVVAMNYALEDEIVHVWLHIASEVQRPPPRPWGVNRVSRRGKLVFRVRSVRSRERLDLSPADRRRPQESSALIALAGPNAALQVQVTCTWGAR